MVFHCLIFLGRKAIIITSKHVRYSDLFYHYNLILRQVKEKLPQKTLLNTKLNVLMPPGHLTVKSNLFNMAAVSVKRSILMFVNFHNQSPLNKLL